MLVGVGFMIAVSGWLIRRRAGEVIAPPARGLHDGLLFALMAVAVASYLVRRRLATGGVPAAGSPAGRLLLVARRVRGDRGGWASRSGWLMAGSSIPVWREWRRSGSCRWPWGSWPSRVAASSSRLLGATTRIC